MKTPTNVQVDIADPSSIAKGLVEAEDALQVSEERFEEVERSRGEALENVAYWRHMVGTMQTLIGGRPETQQQLSELQGLVVEVVNRAVRKIRAKDVTRVLNEEGHEISGDSVSNALWYAAEKLEPRPIQRAGRGFYAPLAYKEDDLTPLLAAAGLGLGAIALLGKGGS